MAAEGGRAPVSLSFLPRDLRRSLLDFQKKGVQFGIRKDGRCLIGDEMGLGKTLQAISIAYYYKDEWPLLVVVPSSMRYPWIEELEQWLPQIEPHEMNLIRSGTDISNIPNSKINLMGYGLATLRGSSKLLVDCLGKQDFQVVILDESHYLKNRNAGRTKVLQSVARKAKRKILLSGTPSLARPEELYPQLDIVAPGRFGSYHAFTRRYCEAFLESIHRSKYVFHKWNARGASNLNELHRLLREHVMIRRLKKGVLTQLPPKRRQKITFDLSDSEYKKELVELRHKFKKQMESGTPDLGEVSRLSTLLYHVTGLAKVGPAKQYISDLLDCMDNKCLVFTRHRDVMKALERLLVTKATKYIKIAGDVPSSIRGEMVCSFQRDKDVRVALLAIEAASFGLTLTAADHVVFVELHYTPGLMLQAEDRAHRIGQRSAVNIHYLVARGTLDEILWSVVRRKVLVTSSTLDGSLRELQAQEGDEDTARQLSACSAWIQQEEEDDGDLASEFLFSQTSYKAHAKDPKQRDLRTFFTSRTFSPGTPKTPCPAGIDGVELVSRSSPRERSSPPAPSSTPATVVLDESDEDDDLTAVAGSARVCRAEQTKNPALESEGPNIPPNMEEKVQSGEASIQPRVQSTAEPRRGADGDQDENTVNSIKPKGFKLRKKGGQAGPVSHKSDIQCAKAAQTPALVGKADSQSESQDILGSYMLADQQAEATGEPPREAAVVRQGTCTQSKWGFLSSLKEFDLECQTLLPKRGGVSECLEAVDPLPQHETEATDSHVAQEFPDSIEIPIVKANHSASDEGLPPSEGHGPFLSQKGDGNSSETKDVPLKSLRTDTGDFGSPEQQGCCGTSPTEGKTSEEGLHVVKNSDRSSNGHVSGDSFPPPAQKVASRIVSLKDEAATEAVKAERKRDHSLEDVQTTPKSERTNSSTSSRGEQQPPVAPSTKSNSKLADSLDDSQAPSQADSAARAFKTATTRTARKRHRTHRKKSVASRGRNSIFHADWPCGVCTLLNDSQLSECSMCFTPRKKAANVLRNSFCATAASSPRTSGDSPMEVSKSSGGSDELFQMSTAERRTANAHASDVTTAETPGCRVSRQCSVAGDPDFVRGPPPWCCTACTFQNDWQLIECSICLTPRRRSQRKVRSAWSTRSLKKVGCNSPSSVCGQHSRTSDDPNELRQSQHESSPDPPPRKRPRREGSGDVSPVETEEFSNDGSDGENAGMDSTNGSLPDPSDHEGNISELQAAAEELFGSNSEREDDWWDASDFRKGPEQYSADESLASSSSHDASSDFQMGPEQPSADESPVPSSSCGEASGSRTCPELPSADESPVPSSSRGEASGFRKCSDAFMLSELQTELQSNNSSAPCGKESEKVDAADEWALLGCSWDDDSLDDIIAKADADEGAQGSLPGELEDVPGSPEVKDPEPPPEPLELLFVLSRYTDRAYLYNEDGEPLGVNFSMADLENGDTDNLPPTLRLSYNLKQARRMQIEWKRMSGGKRRVLKKSCLIFKSPSEGYERARLGNKETSSTVRHSSKEARQASAREIAAAAGGHVRAVTKPSSSRTKARRRGPSRAVAADGAEENSSTAAATGSGPAAVLRPQPTCLQAVNKDGVPLCLHCGGPVTAHSTRGRDWDERFCSYDCKVEHQVRISGRAVRRHLFEAERGVCQRCHLDAHALYESVRALPKRERRVFLEESPFASLNPQVLNRLITDPKEGLFWEADHIRAVAEGGGECGLDNYRTLCVPCHRRETDLLRQRLRTRMRMEKVAGCADITAFFQPS